MVSTKQRRDRMYATKVVRSRIHAGLSQYLTSAFQDRVDMIIHRNCQLIDGASPSFYRFGKMYTMGEYLRRQHTIGGVYYEKINKELHPELWGEFTELEQQHKKNEQYLKDAKHFVDVILMKVPTYADVRSMIPPSYMQDAGEWGAYFDIGKPMTGQERMEFKEQNRKGNEAIIKLQLLEMIRS